MPETSANPAGVVADLLRYLVERGTAALPQWDLPVGLPGDYTNPQGLKPPPMSTRDLGKAAGSLVPQSTADVILSATPLGVLRVGNPKAITRSILGGSSRGLDPHTITALFDNALGGAKAVRLQRTGQVFGADPGKVARYHDQLIEEMGTRGDVSVDDMMAGIDEGFIFEDQFVSEADLESALLDALSRAGGASGRLSPLIK